MNKTRLIPFDAEKAKKGAKVVTRCGYPVTIIGCNSNKKYPIRAIIKTEDGPFTFSFTVEGKYCVDEEEHELDFFIEEEDVEAEEEEEVEETDYDPYKATVESIADMIESYSELQSLEDLQNFYNNIKVQCKDAVEYDSTWNKKQDEPKTSDSFEISPYKWYTCIEMCHSKDIIDFAEGHYYLGSDILKYCLFENDKDYKDLFRPWDINDAKDGDVLAVNNEVFIYAHKKQMYPIAVAHCFVNSAGGFYLDGEFGYKEHKKISPATKEQRELLFQAIKEDGYEWDEEKKELKKIEEAKTRRMTNQELSWWLRECPEEHREYSHEDVRYVQSGYYDYFSDDANVKVDDGILIRRNGGEWEEPLIEE